MNRKELYLVTVVMTFLFLALANAQPVFKQNQATEINIPCTINGAICSPSAQCQLSIIYPNGTVMVNLQNLTQNAGVFSYPLPSNLTSALGEYEMPVTCCDGSACGVRHLTYTITPNGEIASTGKGILYVGVLAVLFIFFIICVYFGLQMEIIALKTFLLLFGYILFIGITFIAWNLSIDYLTSAPFLIVVFKWVFYFFLVAFFPTLLVAVIYTLYMMTQIDAIKNMIDRGMPEDEAYERTVRSGFARKRQW
jgi:hypothetical protein